MDQRPFEQRKIFWTAKFYGFWPQVFEPCLGVLSPNLLRQKLWSLGPFLLPKIVVLFLWSKYLDTRSIWLLKATDYLLKVSEYWLDSMQILLDIGGIQYLRKQVEVGRWSIKCLRLQGKYHISLYSVCLLGVGGWSKKVEILFI